LDKLNVVKKPLDVLAQQMVATVASLESTTKGTKETNQRRGEAGVSEEALWQLVRSAYPYKDLAKEEYEQVLEMLSEGVETRRSRRSAYIHRDRLTGMLPCR